MRSLFGTFGSALLFFTLACGGDDSPAADAGGREDGGAGRDAAVDAPSNDAASDGGSDDDAGTIADAGIDAGPAGSPGCTSGSGIPEGESTFVLEGMERRYVVHLPAGYTRDRAWPLVLALHPNGGSIDYWNQTSGSRNIRAAVENDAILIVVEAIDGQWRDYSMPEDTWAARIETELAYIDAIVERARSELCVDEGEIFSMGFSGGGSFSGVLGCRRSYIRAIAVGGSVIYFDPADCVSAPAAWITIGTMELTSGREQFRDYFRDAASCDATSMATDPMPCVAYDGCDPQTPVHYCQHAGGHVWPDFGTAAAWSFFQRFIE